MILPHRADCLQQCIGQLQTLRLTDAQDEPADGVSEYLELCDATLEANQKGRCPVMEWMLGRLENEASICTLYLVKGPWDMRGRRKGCLMV